MCVLHKNKISSIFINKIHSLTPSVKDSQDKFLASELYRLPCECGKMYILIQKCGHYFGYFFNFVIFHVCLQFDIERCHFLVDLDLGDHATDREPNYSRQSDRWITLKSIPFLDSERYI